MRIESNRARGIFRQLHVVILRGLTCRLHSLYHRIEATKLKLEVCRNILLAYHVAQLIKVSQLAVDEQQTTITECATSTVLPNPAAGTYWSVHRFGGYSPYMVP